MAKSVVEFSSVAIGQLNISINSHDELVITGSFQGVTVAQTLPNIIPAWIFFDPVSTNFFIPQNLLDLGSLLAEKPDLRFFRMVKSLTGI